MPHPRFGFLFKRTQFIYSIILVILIPAALVVNTLWVLRSVDRDVNLQLRQEALLVGAVIGNVSSGKLTDPTTLNKQLAQLKQDQSEIKNVSLLVPNGNQEFRVVASSNLLEQKTTDPVLSQLVFSSGTPHAALVRAPTVNEQVWSVITPQKDSAGKISSLVDIKISTTEIDQITARSTKDSLIVLGVTVLIVLLLLVNHLRFFEYALLFRRLQEVDQMKDDFISMASHELRTPLVAIRGFAEALKEDLKRQNTSEVNNDADTISVSTMRLNELVDDLLNVSRLEGNRLNFDLKKLSPGLLITAVVEQLKIQADQKGLTLTVNLLEKGPMIMVDEMRLKQVLVNLIVNAIKYTPQGEVKISEVLEGKVVHIYVEDTGLGMSPESREHLFEKFYRVRTEDTKEIVGTGLGLWITKQIVEKMNGKIYVDSLEGKGSRFTVDFEVVA